MTRGRSGSLFCGIHRSLHAWNLPWISVGGYPRHERCILCGMPFRVLCRTPFSRLGRKMIEDWTWSWFHAYCIYFRQPAGWMGINIFKKKNVFIHFKILTLTSVLGSPHKLIVNTSWIEMFCLPFAFLLRIIQAVSLIEILTVFSNSELDFKLSINFLFYGWAVFFIA